MKPIVYVLTPLLLLGGAGGAAAQEGFLFNRPVMQLTLRGGPQLPRAQSDVFDFMTSELTLERDDFRTASFGIDLVGLLGNHFDLAVGLSFAKASESSEFREWLGADGLPIAQNTRLLTIPANLSVRFHPISRGRHVADYAWLPARTSPYIGGGIGATWYELRQEGEFLNVAACEEDPDTGCDIFATTYESSDVALALHALAGIEYWLHPRIGVNVEARYNRGSADLNYQYRNWDRLDLTNIEAGLGLSFRW